MRCKYYVACGSGDNCRRCEEMEKLKAKNKIVITTKDLQAILEQFENKPTLKVHCVGFIKGQKLEVIRED